MRQSVRRRLPVLFGLLGLVLMRTGGWCLAAEEPHFDGVTLRVATFGGSWRDAIHELIGKALEKRGARVEYVVGNPRDNLAKLIAARGRDVPFDVMEIEDGIKPQLLGGQFLEDLNFTNLPNGRDLDPDRRDRYTVATNLVEHGIVYNVNKFAELGLSKPERLKDLFHPKLAGRVSFPDINIPTAINGIVALAVEGGGGEGNVEPGFELVKQLKVASFYRSSVELATKFGSGDVWAAWWTAGWGLRVKRAGVPLAMSFQKVKDKQGMFVLLWAVIPKGGKARRAAEFFIDRYLDTETQIEFSKKTGTVPVRKDALGKLAADPEVREFTVLDPAHIRNMYYVDWSKVNIGEWVDKWSRVMAR